MGPRTRRPSPAGATCPPTCPTGPRSTGWTRICPQCASRVVGPVARLGDGGPDLGRDGPASPTEPQLSEFDFGAWDGLTFDAGRAARPRTQPCVLGNPGDIAAPGGESFFDVGARVAGAIAELYGAHPGADLIAVAHMGVILAISASHAVSASERRWPPDRPAFGHAPRPDGCRVVASPRSITSPDRRHQPWRLTAAPAWRPMGAMTYQLLIGQRGHSSWSLRGWLPFAVFGIDVAVHATRIYSDEFAAEVAAFGGAGTVPVVRTPKAAC
jgi:hypothetical protein